MVRDAPKIDESWYTLPAHKANSLHGVRPIVAAEGSDQATCVLESSGNHRHNKGQ